MDKHKRLQRIATLQRRLFGLSSVAATQADKLLKMVCSEERQLIGQLEFNETLMSLFPDLVLAKMRETACRRLDAEKQFESQRITLLEHGRRLKHIERMAAHATSQHELREFAQQSKCALDLVLGRTEVSST